ncbi:MAG TPA: DUF2203 domain-containing protein [Candidatus Binatia bacterium]|nr:DUF2203 domain-containing protein [Candidatus Binatia bacterium]
MDANHSFPRLFTVNEANELLPILRPLVEQVLENIRRLKSASETAIRKGQLDPEAPDLMEKLREDSEIAKLIGQVKGWVDEINSYGCTCKGVEQGLVDFPCMLGAEVVFLCWQIGEPSVSFWHRIEDGFAGRKPLLDGGESDPDSNVSYH